MIRHKIIGRKFNEDTAEIVRCDNIILYMSRLNASSTSRPKRKEIAPKNKWTPAEDEALRRAVKMYNSKSWRMIALEIPGRTSKQCLERWYGKLNPDLLDTEFTKEEDQILIEKQKIYGNKWSQISTFLPGRSTISVRNRWDLLKRHEKNPALDHRIKRANKTPTPQTSPEPEESISTDFDFDSVFSGPAWRELNDLLQPESGFLFQSYNPWTLS